MTRLLEGPRYFGAGVEDDAGAAGAGVVDAGVAGAGVAGDVGFWAAAGVGGAGVPLTSDRGPR